MFSNQNTSFCFVHFAIKKKTTQLFKIFLRNESNQIMTKKIYIHVGILFFYFLVNKPIISLITLLIDIWIH